MKKYMLFILAGLFLASCGVNNRTTQRYPYPDRYPDYRTYPDYRNYPQARKNMPPPWAPAHGVRAKVVYFPAINMYYLNNTREYLYYERNQWRYAYDVPYAYRSYDLKRLKKEYYDYNGRDPYRYYGNQRYDDRYYGNQRYDDRYYGTTNKSSNNRKTTVYDNRKDDRNVRSRTNDRDDDRRITTRQANTSQNRRVATQAQNNGNRQSVRTQPNQKVQNQNQQKKAAVQAPRDNGDRRNNKVKDGRYDNGKSRDRSNGRD